MLGFNTQQLFFVASCFILQALPSLNSASVSVSLSSELFFSFCFLSHLFINMLSNCFFILFLIFLEVRHMLAAKQLCHPVSYLQNPKSLTAFFHFVPPLLPSRKAGSNFGCITFFSKNMWVSYICPGDPCHQTRGFSTDISRTTSFLFLDSAERIDWIHQTHI